MSNSPQKSPRISKPINRSLTLNLTAIGAIAIILLIAVIGPTIQYVFDELENEEVATHQARVATFKSNRLAGVGALSVDWGHWDDTYEYVLDFNEEFRVMNLLHDTLGNVMVDGVLIWRYSDGEYLVDAFDRETGEQKPELAKDLLRFGTSTEFLERLAQEKEFRSYARIKDKLYAVAAIEINRNDLSAEPPGFLIFLSEIKAERVSEALQADTSIVLDDLNETPTVAKSDDRITITAPVVGLSGAPIAQVKMVVPRPLTSAAEKLLLMVLGGTIVVVVSILVVLQLRVRQLILNPIRKLHSHLKTVRSSGELEELRGLAREDEFGAAKEEFNLMAQELRDLRAKLESQSFTLGRTQSAIGLMHNLRNSLAPVRVILETLDGKVNTPLPPQTQRALDELKQEQLDQDRREKLVQFLSTVHSTRAERDSENQLVVREAARNLMNAFDAIDATQNGEGETNFQEHCDIAKILSHSCNVAKFTPDLEIRTDVTADTSAIVSGNRVLLAQVIENLVTNAVEAIRKTDRPAGRISLCAKADPASGKCYIDVIDDGIGFAPDESQNLFDRDYSTREGKSGGLGLHWCSNTINAMGGELSIASKGPGQGAAAQIVLALADKKVEETTLAA